MQLFCVLAEHQPNVLRERTQAGLSSARARGRVGRPKSLSYRYDKIKDLVRAAYEGNNVTTEGIIMAFKIT